MRLSNSVELRDVEEASRLHQEALKQSATDPTSGTINLDIITTGQSEGYRKRREDVKKAFKALLQKRQKVQDAQLHQDVDGPQGELRPGETNTFARGQTRILN